MTNDFKCELGNVDDCTKNDHLYPSVNNAINKIAIKEGYSHYNIYEKKLSADGGNVFGVLYEINIKGETVNGVEKETNIFIKQVISNDNLKLISVAEITNKEIFIYNDLAKIYNELQDKAAIANHKKFKLVKIYDESNSDALILENLNKQGFETYDRWDEIPLTYAELCMKQLAKFHALAFVIERKMPEYHESKIKSLKQSLLTNGDYKVFANKIYKIATRKFPSELKTKVDEWWNKALEDYSKYMQGKMTAVKCLCHGDYKTNNIMYREIEGKITDVIAVDYQLAHYGSPVLDVLYYICMSTDKNFRRKYLSHLKNYYHVSLAKYLKHFDMDIDDVYPKKEFEKDFEESLDFALVTAICVLPITLNSEEGEPDLVDSDMIHIEIKFHDSYYDRLKDIFDDFFTVS